MRKSRVKKNSAMVEFESIIKEPTSIMRQIGALLVAESQEAFKKQKFGGEEWKSRGKINVMGIIADFAAGKSSPPARRFQSRPVLIDTGRLRQSITFKVKKSNEVVVGSNLPYAGVHQYGGETESEVITDAVQAALSKWLKSSGKAHKSKLGFLLSKKMRDQTIKAKLPARPFIGVTDQTIIDIADIIGVTLSAK